MGQFVGGFSPDASIALVDDFLATLSELGVVLPEDSAASAELESVRELMGWIKAGKSPPVSEELRTKIQNSVCAMQVVELTLRRRLEGSSLRPFLGHFRLLETGSMRLSAEFQVSSTAASGREEQIEQDANNRLFELLVGLAVAGIGSDVQLEEPGGPLSKNPDVTATIGGRRWGFACKVPKSPKPSAVHGLMQSGFRQIDRSDVDLGLVILSTKNIVPSSDYIVLKEIDGKAAFRVLKTSAITASFARRIDGLMDDLDGYFGSVGEPVVPYQRHSIPWVYWVGSSAVLSNLGGPWRPTLHVNGFGSEIRLQCAQRIDRRVVEDTLDQIHGELSLPNLDPGSLSRNIVWTDWWGPPSRYFELAPGRHRREQRIRWVV